MKIKFPFDFELEVTLMQHKYYAIISKYSDITVGCTSDTDDCPSDCYLKRITQKEYNKMYTYNS